MLDWLLGSIKEESVISAAQDKLKLDRVERIKHHFAWDSFQSHCFELPHKFSRRYFGSIKDCFASWANNACLAAD